MNTILLFDAMPATFQSAADPSGIKKEDLVQGLRRCLAGTPQFAEHCLPLLMEKLTSDLKGAKIDALETLVSAFCSVSLDSLLPLFLKVGRKMRKHFKLLKAMETNQHINIYYITLYRMISYR